LQASRLRSATLDQAANIAQKQTANPKGVLQCPARQARGVSQQPRPNGQQVIFALQLRKRIRDNAISPPGQLAQQPAHRFDADCGSPNQRTFGLMLQQILDPADTKFQHGKLRSRKVSG